jgi:RNA polymerase sigma-70 factor (ECF subfamily)
METGLAVSGVTDEELVAALQSGDMPSLGQLVVRWERPLYRFVSRMVPRPEDARDVCQETFLRVLNRADRFRAGSRFSTWMYQIALNLCRDQARHRRRWGKIVDDSKEAPTETTASAGPSPEAGTELNELSRAVRNGLQEIPAEQREVLILKEYEGLKFKEIAEVLSCPESTVKSRMYYGLNGLKNALARQGIR